MSRTLRLVLMSTTVCLCFAVLASTSAQPGKGKKYALLVGVTEYEHAALEALHYTENDVEKLGEILGKATAGFEVRLLTVARGKKDAKDMPTRANIQAALDEILDRVKRHDTVLVALSGHGVQLEVADPDDKGPVKSHPFFCPVDADFRKVSYSTGKAPRLINLNQLLEDLAGSKASSRFVLVDACRNEYKAESATRNADVDRVSIPRGVGVLFSCKSKEKAWESSKLKHGVFFHAVLEGLRGKAKNEYGEVDWDSLVARVKSEVPRSVQKLIPGGARQTPHGITNTEGVSVLVQLDATGTDNPRPPTTPVEKEEWGKEIVSSYTKMKLMRIIGKGEKATFQMGSPASEKDRRDDEQQHEVELTRPFWLGKHEVTQGEFKRVMGYNPSCFSRDGEGKAGVDYGGIKPAGGKGEIPAGDDPDSYPVENVSWEEAKEFCEKLTKLESGRVYRLPSEAEWEYACRGSADEYKTFHFGNTLTSTQANFNNGLSRTCKVGSYSANGFGLNDMHGNVWERCADWYYAGYYSKSPRANPENTVEASVRVVRGGGWGNGGQGCRSACRLGLVPAIRFGGLGFRLAAVPPG